MVKQGQFAKVSQQKQIKNHPIKHGNGSGRVIDRRQFADFLLGRYVLTARKHMPSSARETGQRFLQELAPRLLGSQGNEEAAVAASLQYALGRVPWQFFWQIDQHWDVLANFLRREVPAVPLKERLLIRQPVDKQALDQMMVKLLAKQAAVATTLNRGGQLADKLAVQLGAALQSADGIDWQQVRRLIGPLPFDASTAADEGTRAWLTQLQQL